MVKEEECRVQIDTGKVMLEGDLCVPPEARGVVAFAHGSGSSRHSPRNRYVAQILRDAGLATLLFDLLTPQEEIETAEWRFDIDLLARRLVGATDWLQSSEQTRYLKLGYFGASTGAAAALVAAAQRADVVTAIVSRGGRPDLAAPWLNRVKAPTLLIVGGNDFPVIQMNRAALAKLNVENELAIVPGATHLFEEPGTLEQVGQLASDWFVRHLAAET
jgi:putative phosphoribosyl transferase